MVRNKQKVRKVLVVLWLAGSAGRKQLTGILQYINSGHPWSIQLITEPEHFTNETIRKAKADGVDGFIVHAESHTAEELAASTIPTVLMDFPPPRLTNRTKAIAIILDSDERIGEIAAEYYLRLGRFASWAFIPDQANRGWSRLRERGFKNALRHQKIDCLVYGERKGSLEHWLKSLPKPAAVLAACDLIAQKTIAACKTAGLRVPDQVSVLGVDNDELICNYTAPSISTVRIDHEAIGFEAAKTLETLMRYPSTNRRKKIFMPADKVIERESTSAVAPGTHLVEKALTFIEEHAADGIGVSDVVRHLSVSRRLADRRFGAATGSSIRCTIEKRRLYLVQKQLQSSSLSIEKISRLCGYSNPQRLKYVFKKHFGCSMREWRLATASEI